MSKPTLIIGDKRHPIAQVQAGEVLVGRVEIACPACGASPLDVRGNGQRPSADDQAIETDAFAMCCRAEVGRVRVDVSTIFGVREDLSVLQHGRARVYG